MSKRMKQHVTVAPIVNVALAPDPIPSPLEIDLAQKKDVVAPAPEPEPTPPDEDTGLAGTARAEKGEGIAMPMDMLYAGGAATFEELEAYHAAREMAEEAHELTWDLESLISNVLKRDDIEDKASALKALADEYAVRIGKVKQGGAIGEMKSFIASIGEKWDRMFTEKQVASDYLVVEDPKTKSTWHLPVRKNGKADHTLMGAAWAALHGGYRGNKYEGPKKAEALRKLIALYRSEKMPLPATKESSFIVGKDAEGHWRWFGWVSNKYRDHDWAANPKEGGEIICEEAHKEWVDYLDVHPQHAPHLRAWHTPGTETEKAVDWWDFANGFLVMSGPLTEDEAQRIQKAAQEFDLGMSHTIAFLPEWKDEEKGIIYHYLMLEATFLPIEAAANIWTGFDMNPKEVAMAFTPKKRSFLEKIYGADKTKEYEGHTEDLQKELEDMLRESKEAAETPAPPPKIGRAHV